MPHLSDVDKQIRALQDEAISAYEEKLKGAQTRRELAAKSAQDRQGRLLAYMQALRLDSERLDHLDQEDEVATSDFLRQVRPSLIEQLHNQGEGVNFEIKLLISWQLSC